MLTTLLTMMMLNQAPANDGNIMHITCYTASPTAYTYSGQQVHEGGCASNKENLGKTAYLYTTDTHELVAKLECNDIGGAKSLRNGTSLDVFMPTYDLCWDFIGMYGTELYVVMKDERKENGTERKDKQTY